MSASHTPIDLDAIAHQPPVAPATEAAADGSGHAALGNQSEDVEVPAKPHVSPPVPYLGVEAAANMTKLAKAAAQDIRQLGQLAFDAGKRVQEECEQMARDVEANGGTVALHLTGLSQLLAEVGSSNRDTLRRLVGGRPPAMRPPADEDQAAEQQGGRENATQTEQLNRGRGGRISTWLRG